MRVTFSRLLLAATIGAGAALVGRRLARQARRLDFNDRVVLVTGGSRGLGLVLAEHFLAEGARVALCAREEDELRRAEVRLGGPGSDRVMTVQCDIANASEVDRMVREIVSRLGRVDVLVNNAGVIQVGPVDVMTRDDYETAMQIHYWGTLNATLAVLPEMRRRGSGRIVNITSIGGKLSVPHLVPYCASKFAQVGLSQGMRAELSREGIYVTTICPGLMRTGSPLNAFFKGQHEAEYAWFAVCDSTPIISLSAEQAARQIIDACRYGDAEAVLGWPAKVAALTHGVAPGLVADVLGMVNRLMPGPGGIGQQSSPGRESHPRWLPEWLTSTTTEAARHNNQLAASASPDAPHR